jgi:beta-glucanase (GH16 family)
MILSWGDNKKCHVGEHWGVFHPDKLSVYYGAPELRDNSCAAFAIKHKPKEFIHPKTKEKIIIPKEIGILSSALSHRQRYGRFECRMKIPTDKYIWPAFWMWGETWPPEIDVIEAYGGKDGKESCKQEINLHFGSNGDNHSSMKAWSVKVDSAKKFGDNFHEYVLDWYEDKLIMYTDGIKIFQYSRKDLLDKWFNVDNCNMWIVIGTGLVENSEVRDDPNFYSEVLVDYIRAYKHK